MFANSKYKDNPTSVQVITRNAYTNRRYVKKEKKNIISILHVPYADTSPQ